MVEARDLFGLVALGDTLYATAGIGNHGVYHSSVETFSRQEGWRLQEGMDLGAYRYEHCSVALGSRLVVLGGFGGFASPEPVLRSVKAFDTAEPNFGWSSLADLPSPRFTHACLAEHFLEQEGIFVSGGHDGDSYSATVDFYFASLNTWVAVSSLETARVYHSMNLVGGLVAVVGGARQDTTVLDTVELFNNSRWQTSSTRLLEARMSHGALLLPHHWMAGCYTH